MQTGNVVVKIFYGARDPLSEELRDDAISIYKSHYFQKRTFILF